ncbi:MAG: type II toxin-antitoxin system HicB family antitoxin [Bryobacteraceae bacterium]
MYAAKLQPDDNNTILVTFPDVPEVITFGVNRADAMERAKEALRVALSMYVEKGHPLPAARPARHGLVEILLPGAVTAKLALYEAMHAQQITQAELARRLGCHRQHASRIVDPAHNTKFEVLEAALAAVGKRAALVIEDAA